MSGTENRNKYKVRELDMHEGDVVGIKSVTIEFDGENAFGYLKSENGYTVWCGCRHSILPTSAILRSHPFMFIPWLMTTLTFSLNPADISWGHLPLKRTGRTECK